MTAGESVVRDELSRIMLPYLSNALARAFPAVDHDPVNEAASRTLTRYFNAPPSLRDDSSRSVLAWFLRSARNQLKDLLRASRRRHRREENWGRERDEQWRDTGEWARAFVSEAETLADSRVPQEGLTAGREEAWRWLSSVCTDGEWKALLLLGEGEHATVIFAEALGLGHLGEVEQAAEVKRVKDRLRARIRRAREIAARVDGGASVS